MGLPRRQWKVDRPAIAKACGANNRKFWKPKRVSALLVEYDAQEPRRLNIPEGRRILSVSRLLGGFNEGGSRVAFMGRNCKSEVDCGCVRHQQTPVLQSACSGLSVRGLQAELPHVTNEMVLWWPDPPLGGVRIIGVAINQP